MFKYKHRSQIAFLAISSFLAIKVFGLDNQCYTEPPFPLQIGLNTYGSTFAAAMDYNSNKNRLVTVGYSTEPDFCQNGKSSCNFIKMFTYENMEVQWSQTFDGLVDNVQKQQVTFSSDGSLIAYMYQQPQIIVLMDAQTGKVRASLKSNSTVSSTYTLPNLIVTGSSTTFAEIYVQGYKSSSNLTITKFIENPSNGILSFGWEKNFNKTIFSPDLTSIMLKIDEERGTLFSGTNQLRILDDTRLDLILAINCSTGSLIWGAQYPANFLGYFANFWVPENKSHQILSVQSNYFQRYAINNSGIVLFNSKISGNTLHSIQEMKFDSINFVFILDNDQNEGLFFGFYDFFNLVAFVNKVYQPNTFLASRLTGYNQFYSLISTQSILLNTNGYLNLNSVQSYIFYKSWGGESRINISPSPDSNQLSSEYNLTLEAADLIMGMIVAEDQIFKNTVSNNSGELYLNRNQLLTINFVNTNQSQLIDKLEVQNIRNRFYNKSDPLNSTMFIDFVNQCSGGRQLIMTDYDIQIKHKNGTFLLFNQNQISCQVFGNWYSCNTKISTLRNYFGLNSRNDTLTIRVKKSKSVDKWFYNSLTDQTDQIPSQPDTPIYPPYKSILSNFSCLMVNFQRNFGPQLGMEELIWYEVFIKNVTRGDNKFSLYKTLNGTIPTEEDYYQIDISLKVNQEYHFMYRAVNFIGPSSNSTVGIFTNFAPPNGLIKAPTVKLNISEGYPIIEVSWNKIQNSSWNYTGYYVTFSNYYGGSSTPVFEEMPYVCDFLTPSVNQEAKCSFSLYNFEVMPPFQLQYGQTIFARVQACNENGCSNPSSNSFPGIIYGSNPWRGPYYVQAAENSNRKSISLFWETIPRYSQEEGGFKVDYSLKVQVTFDYLSSPILKQEVFTILNSSKTTGLASFNLYGIDPRITYQNVANHKFVFQVQAYNIYGFARYETSSEPFIYSVPDSNMIQLQKGDLTNKTLVHVVWYRTHNIIFGYDDIVSYELYARKNNTQETLQLVYNISNVNQSFLAQYSFKMNVGNSSGCYFALKARNSFGISNLSSEFPIVAAGRPYTLSQLNVSYDGTNVKISWSDSFEKNGYEFNSFDILFDYNNYPTLSLNSTSSLLSSCNVSSPIIIAKQYCLIPMVEFSGAPLNIPVGMIIKVSAIAGTIAGNTGFTPQGNFSTFIIKSFPLLPYQMFIRMNPDYTSATINWIPLQDQDAGYEEITKYTFKIKRVFLNNNTVSVSTLFIAQQPDYYNYSYNLTGLTPFGKYALMYQASNIFGDSDFNPEQYFSPGEIPIVTGVPNFYTLNDNVVINWNTTFTTEYYYDLVDFEVLFLSSSNNWYQVPFGCNTGDYYLAYYQFCNIKMENFLSNPLYLDIDDNITCKVRISTSNGWSNYTPEFKVTTVKAKPQVRVPNLQIGPKTNSDSIHLMWGALNSTTENGGQGVKVHYQVFWAKGQSSSEWRNLAFTYGNNTQIETKDFTSEKLIGGQQYKFMVQALNQYGQGPNSTVVYATVEQKQSLGVAAIISSFVTAIFSLCS